MARVRALDIAAVVAGVLALMGGIGAVSWALKRNDPRRDMVKRVAAEADPKRDVIIIAQDAPELLEAAAPVPALLGTPALNGLQGFRRMYVIAPDLPALGPFEARLGAPAATLGPFIRRWDIDGIGDIRMDLSMALNDPNVTVRREGGTVSGPCVRAPNQLRCNSDKDWHHIRVAWHPMAGLPIRCIWAHPHDGGRLIFEVHNTPAARELIGIVGIDDGGNPAGGAAVTDHVHFEPAGGGAAIDRDIIAPPRRGTTPYRVDLGGRSGNLSLAISATNAGARWFCFSAFLTN